MSGYVLVDATGLDITKSSQTVTGFYTKLSSAISTDKMMILTNVGLVTPMSAIAAPGSTAASIKLTLPGFSAVVSSNDTVVKSN